MRDAGEGALRIVRMPGREAACLSVWITGGAAADPEPLAGATHLLEHLTLRRCGARDRLGLARTVDRLGGAVDAWTSHMAMGVEALTTRDGVPEAARLLADAVTEPTFAEEDVELERRVALAELELARDDPQDSVEEALVAAAWGEHPLARPVIGTEASVRRLTPEALRRHHAGLLVPGRVLVVAAGDLEGEALAPLTERLPLGAGVAVPPLPAPSWVGRRIGLTRAGSEQVHVRLALPVPGVESPSRPAVSVLNRILGGGQSSRLFQRVREEEGLAYDVSSGLILHRGAGLLEIAWACTPERLRAVEAAVRQEVDRLPGTLLAEEVEVAVEGLVRGLVLDAEEVGGRAALEAAWLLERGRGFDLEEAVAELRAVRRDQVAGLAEEVLRLHGAAVAVCGPEGAGELVA